ncbi:MAG: electron transfer flavoprotein subunit alpha/FixB family protein [Deferribacteraceae bacterium]|jgi:electron transfer flavoprotein alpha subunit|nr:electron transfer flavoprotein subunit alpha/FixB family protein [Deferribacteraceae bacterium]
MKILLFSDNNENYGELCAAAGTLGGEITAFIIADKNDAGNIPVKKAFYVEPDASKLFENYYASFKELVFNEKPDVILISATKKGRYMGARLAAALKTSVLTDLSDMEADGNGIKGAQMYYGGAAVRTVKSKGMAIATLPQGSFAPVYGKAEDVVNIPYKDDGSLLKKVETRSKAGRTVNLVTAKNVVCVGRGVTQKEDIALAEALAKAIGGEVGCSRPVAEGSGFLDTSRYIGVSGLTLKPDVYFAVGISGQIQHIIGINSARIIIAVNKDKNAPIFKVCDYGIVGDLYKVLPILTKMFEGN